jgi:Protein of unknown function (DUF1579)
MFESKPLRLALVMFSTICLTLAVAALAQDDKAAEQAADKKAADKPAAGGVSPEAAFAEFMKMNQPGEHHAHLKQLVGTFDADVEMTMAPGAPAQKSKGKEKAELILDGRYLHGEFSGDMMGMPFTGFSLMGYDNQKKKYFNAWVDSMSTGLMLFDGKCDNGKVFTFTGEYDDPMTKRKSKIRQVTTIVSNDKHTFEWFETGEDGKEFRSMFITYTRTK